MRNFIYYENPNTNKIITEYVGCKLTIGLLLIATKNSNDTFLC